MASYTRQSSFSDGDTITAALFNNEYNQLLTAFSYASSGTTGHKHDGTTGEGAHIPQIGDQDFNNKIVVDSTNNRFGVFVEVSSSAVEQVRFQDGAIVPVTDNDIDLGTSSVEFKDGYFDGTLHADAINFNGTAITATAAELNIMDGVTSTTAELNILDGVTATATELNYSDTGSSTGTVVADKVVTVDSNKDVASFRNITLTGELDAGSLDISGDADIDGTLETDALSINGTAVTSTAAELNILDGVTATASELNYSDTGQSVGTVVASKVVTVDSNKDVASFRNITLTGELDAGSLDISGDADIDGTLETDALSINGTTVTSTAAELNILDGVTSTAAELNILDGVTATASEINTLDGITAVVGELNALDLGSTAVGTAIASKAVILDANKDYTGIRNLTITGELDAATLDISGDVDVDGTLETDALSINGTAVTSTAAELNILDGVTSTAAELNILDGVTATTAELNILDGVTATAAELNILDGVTVTAAEINTLDGITAVLSELNALDLGSTAVGTAIASKAVILDSNKDYTGIRNFTITGELDAATLDISGDADIDGTTNLDVVDIDGAVDMASTLTLAGNADFNGDLDVDGTTNLDVVDIDGAVDMASTLNVTGAITGTSATFTTADNTTQLILKSTDADASVGPRFDLLRDSSSPAANDNLGQIRFLGDDSGGNELSYAFLNCLIGDPTDGAEDGILRIETRVGGANKERVTMDSTETVINDNSADLDFRIETATAANKFFVDGGNNVVVIGNNAPVSSVSVDSTFQIQGNSNANAGMSINRYTSNNSGSYINLSKSRSTSVGDNFTIVQDGDTLGRVSFVAADGTNFGHQAAKIVGALDGTPGENDVPGRLEFHTTGDGNNSPSERMRVNDNGDILINTTTDFGGKVNIARADNNTTLALVCTDNDAADGPILDFIRDSSSPATTDDIAVINFKADDSAGNRDIYAQIAVFSPGVTSGSEQGRIKINTNDGSAGLQNRVDLTTDETVFNQDSHNLDFRVESNGYTHMIFVDGGNNHVGIGTDTPLSALHVATAASGVSAVGTTNDDLVLENSGDVGFSILCPNDHTGSIVFGDPDDNNVGILAYNHNDDSMRFTVGASEAARIISDVLCVGTTTTVADDMTARACHIASNATTTGPSLIVDDSDTSVESGSICMAVMFSNDNAFSAAKYVSFRDIGGEQGSITGDGTGSVAYNTSSDMRLKTNIQDTASQWDTIKALQVRDYEWIGNGNEETGFIAQEIHEQIPQVVYVGGEEAAKEPWSVDYGRITPQLTKALQEAMARIETLESELAKLKGGS